jgi:predicted Rossmann fold nucleotide-binding protein DprA/Smf involved in DNA uptake
VKLIIAGSRTVRPTLEQIHTAVTAFAGESGKVDEIVSGCAAGADQAGENYAVHYEYPVKKFPVSEADRKKNPYLAPKWRNRAMAEYADGALVFWDGESGGSADMVTRMVARKKPVIVVPTRKYKKGQ